MKTLLLELSRKNTDYAYELIQSLDAEYSLTDKKGNSALYHAAYSNKLFKSLMPRVPLGILSDKNEIALFKAIKCKIDSPTIKEYYTKFNKNIINNKEESLLSVSIQSKRLDLVKFFLKKGIELTMSDLNMMIQTFPKDIPKDVHPELWKRFKNPKEVPLKILPQDIFDSLNTSDLVLQLFGKKTKSTFVAYANIINENTNYLNYFNLHMIHIAQNINLNYDLSISMIINNNKYERFWLNEQEYLAVNNLFKTLRAFYIDKTIVKLLMTLPDIEDDILSVSLNIILGMTNGVFIKKPNTLRMLNKKIKNRLAIIKMKEAKIEQLETPLLFLNNKILPSGLKVTIPKTNYDLIRASELLNNCMGFGVYKDKIQSFESCILFLSDKNKLKYCIELYFHSDYSIVQARGCYNIEMPTDLRIEADFFIKEHILQYKDKERKSY